MRATLACCGNSCWPLGCLLPFLIGCATVGPISGGKKDTKPPTLIEVEPPFLARNYHGRSVTFTFDEYIASDVQAKEIFFSPTPTPEPRIIMGNKQIILEFKNDLLPNTTYVITLGTGIKDFHEKVALKTPIQYAFSTGPHLDSLRVQGSVSSPYTGLPNKDFIVGLYDPDSVRLRGFDDLKPRYLAQTDTLGRYSIPYVKAGAYQLLGFKDADASRNYNPGELAASTLTPTVPLLVSADSTLPEINLYAYRPDTVGPRVSSAALINSTNAVITFSEAVLEGKAHYADTTIVWNLDTTAAHLNGNLTKLLLPIPASLTDSFAVQLTGLVDTVSNRADTSLYVSLNSGGLVDTLGVFTPKEASNPAAQVFYFTAPLAQQEVDRYVLLTDTAGRPLAYPKRLVHGGYELHLDFTHNFTPKNNYRLRFDTLLTSKEGYRLLQDTAFKVQPPDTSKLSSMVGNVFSRSPAALGVILIDAKSKRRTYLYGISNFFPQFQFKYLPAGDYQLGVTEDLDHNRRWTPGRLSPLRPPEPIYVYPDIITVREGFDIDQVKLVYPAPNKPQEPQLEDPTPEIRKQEDK